MKNIIHIELRKLLKSPAFWIILGLYTLSLVTVLSGTESFINHVVENARKNSPIPIPSFSLYAFPYVWHNMTYVAGFLKFLLACLVILFITNEYTYRTIRQNIINGMSRTSYFGSKVISLALLSLFTSFVLVMNSLILGFAVTEEITLALILEKVFFVGVYFLEVFAFLSFAFMAATLLQKAGLAIIVFTIYVLIAEPILAFRLPEDAAWFLPMKSIGRMIDIPNTAIMKLFGVNFRETVEWIDILMVVAYSSIFLFFSYLKIRKSDI